MVRAFNLVGLYVKDIESSIMFYTLLGFELVDNLGSVAEMQLSGMRLQFVAQNTAQDQDASFQRDAYGEPKGTGVYLNMAVEKIDAWYAQLKQAGIQPSTEPRDWPWGQREFVARDPDGYKIVFYEKVS